MASKVFLDANVLLDFFFKRDSYEDSKSILNIAIERKIHAYVTPAIVHIVGYWLTKAYGYAKAKQLLLGLLDHVRIVDSNQETVLFALNSTIPDIEDALQYYTAIKSNLDYFISRDRKFQKGAIPSLPIVSPSNFLKQIFQ